MSAAWAAEAAAEAEAEAEAAEGASNADDEEVEEEEEEDEDELPPRPVRPTERPPPPKSFASVGTPFSGIFHGLGSGGSGAATKLSTTD